MEHKFTLKLEWKRLEQVYKLDGREGIDTLDHVLAILDKSFVSAAKETFVKMAEMKNTRLEALRSIEDEEFPEII